MQFYALFLILFMTIGFNINIFFLFVFSNVYLVLLRIQVRVLHWNAEILLRCSKSILQPLCHWLNETCYVFYKCLGNRRAVKLCGPAVDYSLIYNMLLEQRIEMRKMERISCSFRVGLPPLNV